MARIVMHRCRYCNVPIVWVQGRYWGAVGSHAGQCDGAGAVRVDSGAGTPHAPWLPDLGNTWEVSLWLSQ